jgi:hypothetical protein
MSPSTSDAARAHELLCRSRDTGCQVAVIYVGADALAHYRAGRVLAIDGSRFMLAYQDPSGLARRATFDLANPNDVLAVEPVR